MKNVFYLINVSEDWWQLREKKYHSVISTSNSLEGILARLKKVVIKYKTKERFYRRLERTETVKPNLVVSKKRELEYKQIGDKFNDLVEEVVSEALATIKEESNLVRKNKKSVSKMKNILKGKIEVEKVPVKDGVKREERKLVSIKRKIKPVTKKLTI
ncbi:MAG: hypothetical protein H0Z24_05695 [Thermosipho sp. (in: Bacteria)]|nr:hypothetical protein [Thermosipho sp. (in: thermotogales)]